jgi:hypothetical protein
MGTYLLSNGEMPQMWTPLVVILFIAWGSVSAANIVAEILPELLQARTYWPFEQHRRVVCLLAGVFALLQFIGFVAFGYGHPQI